MFNIILLLISICCLTTVRFIEAFNDVPPQLQLQRANYHTIDTTTQLSSSIEEEQATTSASFDDIESYKETNPSAGADGYSILRRPVTVSFILCVCISDNTICIFTFISI